MAGRQGRSSAGWWHPAKLRRHVRAVRTPLLRRTRWLLSRCPRPVQQTWRLGERTVRETFDDQVPALAAETALFTLISLPALLLVILGSLGFIADSLGAEGLQKLHRLVFEVPQTILSARTYDAYEPIAQDVVERGRGDVISIGILVSLWTGSRAMNRYLETITIAYDLEPRSIWRRRTLAFGLTVVALLAAVAILPPLVLGPQLIRWIAPQTVAHATLEGLGLLFWPAVFVLVLAALTSLYHVGVPVRTPWRRDLPGAVLAVCLWLLAAAGLRAYLAVSTRDDAVYSQLGTPIAVVLWLYVAAIAVLIGAELNSEIEKIWPHERHPWRLWRRAADPKNGSG